MSIPFLMAVTSPTPLHCSLHLTLWPSLSLSAFIKPASPPPPLCFYFLSVCTSVIRREATKFRAIHKQPSSRCYDTPQAIVMESHYSWDLTSNPSYVIGLLSAVQAGLTPQTAARSAPLCSDSRHKPAMGGLRSVPAPRRDDEADTSPQPAHRVAPRSHL